MGQSLIAFTILALSVSVVSADMVDDTLNTAYATVMAGKAAESAAMIGGDVAKHAARACYAAVGASREAYSEAHREAAIATNNGDGRMARRYVSIASSAFNAARYAKPYCREAEVAGRR